MKAPVFLILTLALASVAAAPDGADADKKKASTPSKTTSANRELVDRIIAVVNDDIIIKSELDAAVVIPSPSEQQIREVLDQLINERLMTQQIQEANIEVSESDVDSAIQDILRTNNLTEADLQRAIEARNLTMGQYREDLKSQLIRLQLVRMKVQSRVVIPEAEIKAEYERQIRTEKQEELVRIRHLFFKWKPTASDAVRRKVIARAKAARQRVLDGEDFVAVAKAVSQGPTALEGGELGEMNRQQMLPAFARAIEGLETGQMSGPVETPNGVHIVQVASSRVKASTTFAEARQRIYSQLYQREVEAQMQVWLDELRKKAAVTILL